MTQVSLLKRIQSASLEARKARDSVRAGLLVTLFSEASMVGKNDGNRETTDEETIRVIKKFLKGIEEALAVKAGEPTLTAEKAILEEYLPKQMNDDELKATIATIVSGLPQPVTVKNMGLVMKELNSKYTGLFDGSKASAFVKEALV